MSCSRELWLVLRCSSSLGASTARWADNQAGYCRKRHPSRTREVSQTRAPPAYGFEADAMVVRVHGVVGVQRLQASGP